MTSIILFFVAAGALFGFAVYTRFNQSPADTGVPARIWAAIVGAGAAFGAAIHAIFSAGTTP